MMFEIGKKVISKERATIVEVLDNEHEKYGLFRGKVLENGTVKFEKEEIALFITECFKELK